jgi:hypothetical protein
LQETKADLDKRRGKKQLLAQLHFANVNGLWRLDGLVQAAERIRMGSSHTFQGGSGSGYNGFDLHLSRLRVTKTSAP